MNKFSVNCKPCQFFRFLLALFTAATLVSCGGSDDGGGGNNKKKDGGTLRTPPAPFVSVWQIDNAGDTITLPLPEGFTYNFTVDWGDGETDTITSFDDPARTHTYAEAGRKTITIKGTLPAWRFQTIPTSREKILEVTDLGDVGWKNLSGAFMDCRELTTFNGGNVSGVTDMSRMFLGARRVTPDTGDWDTSAVTNMGHMFSAASYARPDCKCLGCGQCHRYETYV